MMRRAFVLLLFTAFVAIVSPAVPASATPDAEAELYCSTWGMRSIVQEWQDPATGSTFSKNKATLVKPEGGGTEFATFDADIELNSPQTLSVDFALAGGAKPDAGAVRLFYYTEQNADTLTTAPTAFVAATGTDGTLSIAGVEKVGTLGVVYDASNSAGGSAIFENMKIGDMLIKFKKVACEVEAPPSPTPSASPSPSPSASSEAPPAAAPGTGGGDELPVTGARTWYVVAGGALLIAAGVAAVLATRRRRVRIENS